MMMVMNTRGGLSLCVHPFLFIDLTKHNNINPKRPGEQGKRSMIVDQEIINGWRISDGSWMIKNNIQAHQCCFSFSLRVCGGAK